MLQWPQLNDILLEIHGCFAEHVQALWERLSFSVERSGKCKVNCLYDAMNGEDGGQLVRELIWARGTYVTQNVCDPSWRADAKMGWGFDKTSKNR